VLIEKSKLRQYEQKLIKNVARNKPGIQLGADHAEPIIGFHRTVEAIP